MAKSKTALLDGMMDEVEKGMTVAEKVKYWKIAL